MSVAVLWGVLAGAASGLISSYIIGAFKEQRDDLRARCDEIILLVDELAQTGARYWSCEDSAESQLDELAIIRSQSKVYGLLEQFAPDLPEAKLVKLRSSLLYLFNALTGGNFDVRGRAASRDRARRVQHHAADVVVAIRDCFGQATRSFITRRWY